MSEVSNPAIPRWRTANALRTAHRDERGMITSMIVRLVVIFALGALIVSESGHIISAQIKAEDAARVAAQTAADDYATSHSTQHAAAAAVLAAQENDANAKVVAVGIARDGTATVTVVEEAHTMIVKRLSFLKGFGEQKATEIQGRSF
jgi:hypothetical protein